MEETVFEYQQNPVHFFSTDKLRSDPWDVDRLLARHAQLHKVVAKHLQLPVSNLMDELPTLNASKDKLVNTEKKEEKKKKKQKK